MTNHQSQLYKVIAIIVSLGLLLPLWPAPLWAEVLGKDQPHRKLLASGSSAIGNTISSGPDNTELLSTLPDDYHRKSAGLDNLIATGDPKGMLLDAAALEILQQHSPAKR